ncbi:MAG TPA: hypothetical protein VHS34_12975 [Terriglobales bacterium]|jgi:hypothetical protein|nr:hypothetical protein [Terriglobales bacterium]
MEDIDLIEMEDIDLIEARRFLVLQQPTISGLFEQNAHTRAILRDFQFRRNLLVPPRSRARFTFAPRKMFRKLSMALAGVRMFEPSRFSRAGQSVDLALRSA